MEKLSSDIVDAKIDSLLTLVSHFVLLTQYNFIFQNIVIRQVILIYCLVLKMWQEQNMASEARLFCSYHILTSSAISY